MNGLLAALRREAHELDCLAAEARAAGDTAMAVHHEDDAMLAWAKVTELEIGDGRVVDVPMDGVAAV